MEQPIPVYNGEVRVAVSHTGKRLHAVILPSPHLWHFDRQYDRHEFNREVDQILDRCNGNHPDLLEAAREGIKAVIEYRVRRKLITVVDNCCSMCHGPLAEHTEDTLKCLFGTTTYMEHWTED